jgi:hypothetical protein
MILHWQGTQPRLIDSSINPNLRKRSSIYFMILYNSFKIHLKLSFFCVQEPAEKMIFRFSMKNWPFSGRSVIMGPLSLKSPPARGPGARRYHQGARDHGGGYWHLQS